MNRSFSAPTLLAAALACATAWSGARAGDFDPLAPPFFAQTASPGRSPWSGLYAGSEIFGVSGKGVKGGIGGGSFIGYAGHPFDDAVVVAVEGAAGYSPSLLRQSFATGYDYAGANVKVGYEIGRVTPFVTAGFAFARPVGAGAGYGGAADSVNGLLGPSPEPWAPKRPLQGVTSVGAGFNYAVTDRLSVGVVVSATQGRAGIAP